MTYLIVSKGDIVNLKVENLVFGGEGVARMPMGTDDEGRERRMAVFIEGVVPGDEVEAEIYMLKRNLARARVKKFLKYGEGRITPKCPHFGMNVDADGVVNSKFDSKKNCGGCSWQMLSYEKQVNVKFAEVRESLVRIGSIDAAMVESVMRPVLAMDGGESGPWNYRNKMDFSFVRSMDKGENGQKIFGPWRIGLHMKGRFYEVTEIDECHLFRPWVGEFLQIMRMFFVDLELKGDGELISLIVRCGTNTGEVMVNLQVQNGEIDFDESFKKLVEDFFVPGRSEKLGQDKLVSVFITHIINKKGQPKQFLEKLLSGKESFTEKLKLEGANELSFDVAPQAFLQPNTKQAEVFYSLIRKLAGESGKKKIFDLFCGTGTIGIALADMAETVVGIEMNAPAVENAKANALLNGVKNIEFKVGDVNKLLPDLGTQVDLIIVDPPRAGLTEKIIDSMNNTSAKEVIYVSCNPTTLARDLKLFLARGWNLKFVQPIDQFAQTYHVETVCQLSKD